GASRPVEQLVARPRIDETDDSDERLLSWIARTTLIVGVTAAVYSAIALRGDCGHGQVPPTCTFNDWVNQAQDWLWYALRIRRDSDKRHRNDGRLSGESSHCWARWLISRPSGAWEQPGAPRWHLTSAFTSPSSGPSS